MARKESDLEAKRTRPVGSCKAPTNFYYQNHGFLK